MQCGRITFEDYVMLLQPSANRWSHSRGITNFRVGSGNGQPCVYDSIGIFSRRGIDVAPPITGPTYGRLPHGPVWTRISKAPTHDGLRRGRGAFLDVTTRDEPWKLPIITTMSATLQRHYGSTHGTAAVVSVGDVATWTRTGLARERDWHANGTGPSDRAPAPRAATADALGRRRRTVYRGECPPPPSSTGFSGFRAPAGENKAEIDYAHDRSTTVRSR